jgi:hypothetical protein
MVTIQNSAKIFYHFDYRIFAEMQKSMYQAVIRNQTFRWSGHLSRLQYRRFRTVLTALQALGCVLTLNNLLHFTLTHPACRYSGVRQLLASHKVLNLQLIRGFPCSGI